MEKHTERDEDDFFITNREGFKEALVMTSSSENLFLQVFPSLGNYGTKWSEILRTV